MRVTSHRPNRSSRLLIRVLAPLAASVVLLAAAPAQAAVPDGWEEVEPVSPLSFLMVLVIIPGGLFLLIALLSAIPSMVRSETSYQPGLAWRSEPEWFGGPRDGLEKADRQPQASEATPERGGASGRW